jgi:hypothetical protein
VSFPNIPSRLFLLVSVVSRVNFLQFGYHRDGSKDRTIDDLAHYICEQDNIDQGGSDNTVTAVLEYSIAVSFTVVTSVE